jgi:predicted dehydrogenase
VRTWTVLGFCFATMLVAGVHQLRAQTAPRPAAGKPAVRLMTLDPGHFHAALIHRDAYPQVAPRVDVYAPLGPDLLDHLKRVSRFNLRAEQPTDWRLEVHSGPDFFERMKKERPGNVVVISGRNRGKIDYIQGSIAAGFHALVDKPWILRSEDLPKLKATLDLAEKKRVIAWDMMTERFEITSLLQRELVRDTEVFGEVAPGTPASPAVYMESVHHLMKTVAGVPNIRPAWFFDPAQQGEGLNDIGTHLVDLVAWTLSPDKPIVADKDIAVLSAQRWPTRISRANFQRVTGEKDFPDFLRAEVKNNELEYYANTLVTYTLRGIHARLNVIWDWEAPAGAGDSVFAAFKGARSRVEIRQGKAEKYRPELYVVPNDPAKKLEVVAAVGRRLTDLLPQYPGLDVEERPKEIRIVIPDRLRSVHEDHFGQVARQFIGYVQSPKTLPAWEKANMIAKYTVTTKGTDLSRQAAPKVAERLAPK